MEGVLTFLSCQNTFDCGDRRFSFLVELCTLTSEFGLELLGNQLSLLSDASLAGSEGAFEQQDSIEVRNPADETVIAHIRCIDRETLRAVIDRSQQAQQGWGKAPCTLRANVLHRWAREISSATEDLARIITLEQGKPLAEARDEVAYAVSFIHWFAEEGRRLYGRTIPTHREDARLMTLYRPVGVAVAITPWNWPLAMITRKAAAALAAGCSFIVKPAPETPLSALALLELSRRAELAEDLFSVVIGDAEMIGGEFVDNPVVRSLSFTGSTRVGKGLIAGSAKTVKKLSMELGGHAPFIVCADAHIDLAVDGALTTKFEAAGQNCIGLNACLVHESAYEEFCNRLVERVGELTIGDGSDPDSDMGPLISQRGVDQALKHIDDACSRGASCLFGGKQVDRAGYFLEPTVLSDVPPDALIMREETFGPVLPVTPFSELDEAIEIANQTEYGLGAYVYARDSNIIWELTEKLQAGLIGVNTSSMTGPHIPFGGVKQSGLGREGSDSGFEPFVELKYVCQGNLKF